MCVCLCVCERVCVCLEGDHDFEARDRFNVKTDDDVKKRRDNGLLGREIELRKLKTLNTFSCIWVPNFDWCFLSSILESIRSFTTNRIPIPTKAYLTSVNSIIEVRATSWK